MQVHYRNSIVVTFLCIGFIAFVTVIKIYQLTPPTSSVQAFQSSKIGNIASNHVIENFHDSISTETTNTKKETTKTSVTNNVKAPPNTSGIMANAYVVGNVQTGEIYITHNQSRVLPVASMSKLVTAFVSTNELPQDMVIEISKEASSVPPDQSFLKEGERFTAKELLQPLLLSSSNVAAEALSSSMDRVEFLELMTGYSWEIGMPSTFFADPSGVSPQNVASALDLFALAKYLYRSRPDILELTRTTGTDTATTTEHGSHTFNSTHPFAGDPRFIGGKTGRTPEAGDTMLTILKIKDQPIAIVVLGSSYKGREGDTKLLIEKVDKIIK